MTDDLVPLDGGPHDIDFYFDPACPFAWLTSRWVVRVTELRNVSVGWRFVSLLTLDERSGADNEHRESHERSRPAHRVCAATRVAHGNAAVGRLYTAIGESLWYRTELPNDRLVDLPAVLAAADLPAGLAAAADDAGFDTVLTAETEYALSLTGDDVGTPIIQYNPPTGSALFGPVISAVPDDDTAVAMYDALRTMVDFAGFSELKRTKRPPLDLPVFQL
jgi:hypothetical protein